MKQSTLSQCVTFRSRQAGVITIRPAAVNSGIRFVRRDVGGGAVTIPADWRNARGNGDDLDLVNGEGVPVMNVSRLLAALKISGVDNAVVEVEMETLDIDCDDFSILLRLLAQGGRERQVAGGCLVTLGKCAAVEAGGSSAVALPSGRLIVELYVESGMCEGGWCLVAFDENAEPAGEDGPYDFGITVKGGDLPPEEAYRQMRLALSLLAMHGACRDMQFRGINFTLEVGLKLLKLVDG